MVHLNKNQLTQKQLDQLFAQMGQTLGKLKIVQSELFLTELLGKEERIMLAKRLATIILLTEGKSLYSISRILKISPSTANSLKQELEKGAYTQILSSIGKSKKNYFEFLNTLDNILHLGGILPHYNGLDRYNGL